MTWARAVGLEAEGFRVRAEKSLVVLSFGERNVGTLFFGDGAFPEEALDDVLLPPAYQPGAGFVGLSPWEPSRLRSSVAPGHAPDLWGEHGIMRVATRAALCLAQHSGVIIMPQARAAREASAFARFVAGYDRPDCRPFGGWLWWSVDDEFRVYRSYGMALFGLPDIEVPADITNNADLDRALDALLFAASTMIWRGWDLEVGSTLDVPKPADVGPTAPLPPSGPCVRYRVRHRALTEADIDTFCRHGRDQQAGWIVLQAE